MCGRFTLTGAHDVARELSATLVGTSFRPRYNVAPTQTSLCLEHRDGNRILRPLRWGFSTERGLVINARSERASVAPLFAPSFINGRCGVAADGFIEWTGPAGAREPHWFRQADTATMIFAGLYRVRQDPRTHEPVEEFIVLTTEPNDTVRPFHDRMPAILSPEDIDVWLAPAPDSARENRVFAQSLEQLLRPAPTALLEPHPVSTRINRADVDDAACLAPRARQTSLF